MLDNGQLTVLNMQDILPNRFQPRIHFDEVKLNELAESIRKYGVIQPIVVRQIGNKFEIVAGERRYKASSLANKATIPAIVINLSDRDSEEIALLENIQRQNLTAIEEAVSYKRILDMGYITQEELARKLGKSQSTIANKVRLLNLDDRVQDALLRGKISERHARSLLRLHNKNNEIYMLNRIVNERLTVKRTDEEINKILESNGGQEGGSQKTIPTSIPAKPVQAPPAPPRRAVPVASHEIIRVNPPKEFEEQIKLQNKPERSQGFMDIDKILQEAQDINAAPEVKQPEDISELMKQNPQTVVSEPIHSAEPVQPQAEPAAMPQATENNKFVNFGGALREEESPAPAPAPMAPSEPSAVSFDSIFNQKPIDSNSQQAPAAPIEPAQPIAPAPAAEPAPAFQAQPQYQEPVQNATPVTPIEPTPPVAPVQPIAPEPEPVTQVQPIEPIAPVQPIAPTPAPVAPVQPIEPTAPAAPVQPIAPTAPIPSSDIYEDGNLGTNEMPSMVNQSVKPVAPSNDAHRLMQAINLVRKCADQIEDLGFYVDVDEINLENSYQVTFKINKD